MTKDPGYERELGMSQRRFANWVESRKWVVAKTMPEWPHEYSAVNRKKDPPQVIRKFEWAELFIRHHGERRRFLPTGSRFDYYECGEYSYWTMGWPAHMTILINRDRYDPDSQLPVLVKRRAQKRG